MFRTVIRYVRDSDHVHLHGQYEYVHIAALIALVCFRRPLSLQPHGTFEPYQLAKGKWRKRIYHYLIGAPLIRRSTAVLFASQSEAERATLVPIHKRVVSPLGVSLVESESIPGLKSWSQDDAATRILFLGRLANKKRPEMLLRAWAAIDRPAGALLVIAGPDDDWTSHSLNALATQLGVPDSVVFIAEVQGGAKTWLYEKCGVFALPSDNENFGITVAEALASGCYCVVTDQVAASEHVTAASAGEVIPSDNLGALAAALQRALHRSPESVKTMSQRARIYSAACFDWMRVARTVLDVTHDAARSGARSAVSDRSGPSAR
jgi:glycosyltransferase involved in cell wall biosynthesis